MDVRITTRHTTVDDAFAALAEERTRKLERFDPRLISIDLIFDEDHGKFMTELRAEVPGIPPLVATAEDDSRRRSLDDALEKLGRQLRKERSKRVDHQAPPAAGVVPKE